MYVRCGIDPFCCVLTYQTRSLNSLHLPCTPLVVSVTFVDEFLSLELLLPLLTIFFTTTMWLCNFCRCQIKVAFSLSSILKKNIVHVSHRVVQASTNCLFLSTLLNLIFYHLVHSIVDLSLSLLP